MSFLARLAPSPLSSVVLFAAWLALSRSTDPGGALLGLALALAVIVGTDLLLVGLLLVGLRGVTLDPPRLRRAL